MTVKHPPSFLQGIVDLAEGHTAQNDRLTLGALFLPGASALSGRSGILPAPVGGNGEVVLVSDVLIRTRPFRAVIQGTRNNAQGQYVVVNDADLDRAITPAQAGVTRLDLLAVVVRDASYAPDTLNNADVVVVRGTPATTGAVAPTLDGPDLGNYLVLGTVTVPPPGTAVTFAPATGLATVAAGGIRPVPTGDTTAGVYEGQWRDLDLPTGLPGGRLQRWTSGAWDSTPRHLGAFTGALPTTGVAVGDTLWSNTLNAPFTWTADPGGAGWRQAAIAQTGGFAAYRAALAAAPLYPPHEGFLLYDTVTKRLWVYRGSALWAPVGGAPGSGITAGFVSQTGWGIGSSVLCRALGNGMAYVNVVMNKASTTLAPTATGDVVDSPMVKVPTGFEAYDVTPLSSAGWGRPAQGVIGTDGMITLSAASPGTITVGETLSLGGIYLLNTPMSV